MPPKNVTVQRRARQKENLRRAILDAARELFVTENFHAISMRRIAEKIEYSPTAIYLHFQDKEEILRSLVEEGFGMLQARMEANQQPDPLNRLRGVGRAYVEFACTQPHYYKIMFQLDEKVDADACGLKRGLEGAKPEASPTPDGLGMGTYGYVRQCVEEAMEKGLFDRRQNIDVVTHVIWSHVHGAVSLILTGHLFKLPAEQQDAFITAVLETTIQGLTHF